MIDTYHKSHTHFNSFGDNIDDNNGGDDSHIAKCMDHIMEKTVLKEHAMLWNNSTTVSYMFLLWFKK